ncbi:TonB-dependent receptor domain-containing protein [Endozoicomonas euniceicola]|uniref:TonB-dependent receptor n=1 Tax=Endozoicomonas euniceicola TaxID=1234143 RepID=A0ABY6GPD6_9GAMM|nr:TonB-dependent receptor [Endozoicomonas euniceicola]UYM14618.1 TonB-dependent receptor [Endozoicomonas euniceicola]
MSYKLQAAIGVAIAGFVNASIAADDVYRLDDVVVTASRTAQTVDQALAPVTVITREEIERSQASSVPELLARTPGVQIKAYGGPGSVTSAFVRGTASAQTQVLVDGQRVNSLTTGTPELQFFDPDQIERIEIVRGAGASLYGADAVGGIIQIFTRQGQGKPHVSLRAGVGNMGTHEFGVNAGGQSGATRFNVGAKLYETGGYDFTNDDYSANKGANLDDDGYRNKSFSASLSREFDNGAEAGVSLSHAQGKVEYDAALYQGTPSPYGAYSLFNNTSLAAYYSLPVSEQWFSRVDIGYTRNKSKERAENVPDTVTFKPSFIETRRVSLLWQNDLEWHDSQLLTLGLDYYNDFVDKTDKFVNPETGKKEDSRYNAAVFVQNQSRFERSDLQLSVRHDKNEAYGRNTTGKVAYGYDLPKAMRLVASYGTAFRAPTFNDLYYPDTGYGVGNPDIKPEKSANAELTLKGNHSIGRWEVSVFQNDIDDLINWAPVKPDSRKTTPSNIDKARIRGFEASLNTQLVGWNIRTSLTLLDPKDTKTDKVLVRRAKQNLVVDADYQWNKWSFGATAKAQGHSYNDTANKDRAPGFATFDIRTAWQASKEVKLEAKLTNLLDKEYYEVKGYRKEPRAGLVSVIWSPEI